MQLAQKENGSFSLAKHSLSLAGSCGTPGSSQSLFDMVFCQKAKTGGRVFAGRKIDEQSKSDPPSCWVSLTKDLPLSVPLHELMVTLRVKDPCDLACDKDKRVDAVLNTLAWHGTADRTHDA